MHQIEQLLELGAEERKRVETVVETLAMLNGQGESLAAVAHDARNMVTALDLYCDLLQEPGVLAPQFAHYGDELKLVAAASRRLVEKLIALEAPNALGTSGDQDAFAIQEVVRTHRRRTQYWQSVPAMPIANLAEELLANRNLLAALAGPAIALTVDVRGGALPVRLVGEDLTRILVNLIKNATEAMSAVGRIHISLQESCGEPVKVRCLTLNVEDNGPGIPDTMMEKIFEPGHTAAVSRGGTFAGAWPTAHRGLGLSICRSIVEAAGGLIRAANRDPVGACVQIELPVSSD
jgi:signal transduction histidine kinase